MFFSGAPRIRRDLNAIEGGLDYNAGVCNLFFLEASHVDN